MFPKKRTIQTDTGNINLEDILDVEKNSAKKRKHYPPVSDIITICPYQLDTRNSVLGFNDFAIRINFQTV